MTVEQPSKSDRETLLGDAAGAPAPAHDDLAELLGPPGRAGRPRWKAPALLALFAILGATTFVAWRMLSPASGPEYVTQPLRRGDLVASVSATGTLEPLNQVEVSSELSGTIEQVLVEDNDVVRRGQVLARLDAARLQDQIAVGEAAVGAAEATLRQAQATVRETGLRRDRVRRLWDTSAGGYPARADVDAAEAAAERAQAAAASAAAAVRQAQATLRTNRTNLTKSSLRSPVAGVVLARQVEPGQTVAASLQAPVLFVIAEDLSRMNLEVDIDEAEVAGVHEGQAAAFTVDAYPGRTFRATVTRVGLGSQTKEGVVTYTAVLAVENADLSLRPGMTATADITTSRREAVLLIPQEALRFTPVKAGGPSSGGLAGALAPRMPRGGGAQPQANGAQIWVLEDGKPVRIPVVPGATNGQMTEVRSPALKPGMQVIVGTAGSPS